VHSGGRQLSNLKDLWTAAFSPVAQLSDDLSNLREILDLHLEKLICTPGTTRPIFNFLREHQPIFRVPGLAVVTKWADANEILGDSEHFSTVYTKAGPDQTVAMRDTPEYRYLTEMLHAMVHPGDLEKLRVMAREWSKNLIAAAPAGRIDAIAQFSRLVALKFIQFYVGVPAPPDDVMRWGRAIFRNVFTNFGGDPSMEATAAEANVELGAHIEKLITTRKAEIRSSGEVPDDILCRLLKNAAARNVPDETVRNLALGLAVGAGDNISEAIGRTIDYLLDNPELLKGASDAAGRYDSELIKHYVLESLRFNPENPFLLRNCEKNVTLAITTSRATLIPEKTRVIVATSAAMFDPDQFSEPETFRIDRPLDKYLIFGSGLHRCFGEHFAEVVIAEAIAALLRLENLQRASGLDGRMQYDGAFPQHLFVQFERS
jgi:cytochrome P450